MSQRSRFILVAAVVGAVLGGTAAWAISQARESRREQLTADSTLPNGHLRFEPSPSAYVQIAVAVATLVRQIVELYRPK